MINIVVAFTFATVAVVVVAPLFGYKLDLLVSSFSDLAEERVDSDLLAPGLADGSAPQYGLAGEPDYTGQYPAYPAYPGQTAEQVQARSLAQAWYTKPARILSR